MAGKFDEVKLNNCPFRMFEHLASGYGQVPGMHLLEGLDAHGSWPRLSWPSCRRILEQKLLGGNARIPQAVTDILGKEGDDRREGRRFLRPDSLLVKCGWRLVQKRRIGSGRTSRFGSELSG